mmetsp:Transcript_18601/g.28118  ORF Transcript_18601/g.28118 Transcript_18601/m.28118 type:complete len:498 (-) Transcript_18601:737-2230(-)
MPPQTQDDNSSMMEPLLSENDPPQSNDCSRSPSEDQDESNKDIVIPLSFCSRFCCCCGGNDTNHREQEEEPADREEKPLQFRMNHNVFLNLLLAVLYGISGSLSNGTALAAYVKKLGNDQNGPFGDIEAAFGLATLITALPVGYLADKWGRAKVIRCGGILLLISTICQSSLLSWVGTDPDDRHETMGLWLLGVLSVMWGISEGVVNGPCSALFADSTPAGTRSKYYNYLFAAWAGATAVGPLVSIILFQTLGDDWDLYDLRIVIYVGLGMEFCNSFLMMLFDDRKALDESSSSDSHIGRTSEGNGESGGGGENLNEHNDNDDRSSSEMDDNNHASNDNNQQQQPSTLQKRQQWIPYIIFTQDLVGALGSGMTIKFFPLFFKDEVGMTPSQVQMIFCITPIVMGIVSTVGSKIAATGFGRVQTQLLFSTLGVSCLYCMVFFKNTLDLHPAWLVPIYVLRTSLINGSYPLQESILMDFVPKEERARWKSLDSVASFGW